MLRVRLSAGSFDSIVRNDLRVAERLPLRLVKHVEMVVTQEVGSMWRLEQAIESSLSTNASDVGEEDTDSPASDESR